MPIFKKRGDGDGESNPVREQAAGEGQGERVR